MAALDRSVRRKIFYGMVLLFAVIMPLVLLYSRGYIFDLKTRDLVATGGIFIKTAQSGAGVFMDSELYHETSFVSRGTLIANLLPRRYTIRVEKAGFRPWQKVVRVTDQEVLEFRDIFLPPATITPSLVYSVRKPEPTRLVILPGRTEVGLEVGDAAKSYTVFVVNPETRRAPINFIKVKSWFWDERSRTFFIERFADGRRWWYRLADRAGEAGKEELVTFRGLPPAFSADTVVPHPSADGQFYFSAGGALFLQGRPSVPIPIAEQVHAYAITSEHLYFVSKNGFFVESDLDGGNTRILGRKGLFLSDVAPAKIRVSPAGDVAVIDSAGGLFLYQPGRDQELSLVVGNVEGVDFSENGGRALLWEDHRLWVYWLKDNPRQPFDLARTKRQIFYSDDPIRSSFLNAEGTHVFFATDGRLRMTEVDDRASTNSYDLVASPIGAFALGKANLALYWMEGQKLLQANLK